MPLPRSYFEYPLRRAGMDHDRFGYANLFKRKPVQWPGGARVALVVVPVLEWFALDVNAGDAPVKVPGAMERPYPDYWNYTMRDYGTRVGIHRIFNVLDELGLPASVAINAQLARRHPSLLREITRRDWEVVAGKFLAVTFLGFSTAIWNIALMVGAVAIAQFVLKSPLLSLSGLAACLLLSLPMTMIFAAGCLTLGVFARSTKEGNYYMVPMFFVVLPLACWSITPGMELDGTMSWVPITNALLLQQRLMAERPDAFPWRHVPAVAASMIMLIAAGLWAAVRQFQREAVLFRARPQLHRRAMPRGATLPAPDCVHGSSAGTTSKPA